MKQSKLARVVLKCVFLFALMLLPEITNAQYFPYVTYGDTLACFRRPSNPSYETIVDISNILTYARLPVGTVTNINYYSTNQLKDAFTNFPSIQWSVLATFQGSVAWSNYPAYTIWFTLPRTDPGTPTTPPARQSTSGNTPIRSGILAVGSGANQISTALATTNSDNNTQLVLEPVGANDPSQLYTQYTYSTHVEDPSDSTVANFGGQLSFSVENITGAPFTSAVVSDFYQSVPTGKVDPTTGLSTGSATYLGYFTLNPNGTMTFTRQSSAVTNSPPPPPTLTITRSGTTSTISFGTTNGATYTLYFTNSAGLKQPMSTWPSVSPSVSGNGSVNSFQDITTDPNRFYRVGAH